MEPLSLWVIRWRLQIRTFKSFALQALLSLWEIRLRLQINKKQINFFIIPYFKNLSELSCSVDLPN